MKWRVVWNISTDYVSKVTCGRCAMNIMKKRNDLHTRVLTRLKWERRGTALNGRGSGGRLRPPEAAGSCAF